MNDTFSAQDFWQRAKTLIKTKNTTQRGLSIDIGYPERTIETWVNRSTLPDAIQTYKIAQALGVSVEYLVTGTDTAISPKIIDDLKNVISRYS